MSHLETQIQPLLTSMIQGDTRFLAPRDQALLARWLYKTGIVAALTINDAAADIPASHYRLLRDHQTLPPSSQVWLAKLDAPTTEAGFWVQRFDWWDYHADPNAVRGGYAFIVATLSVVGIGFVVDATEPSGDDIQVMRPGPLLLPPVAHRIWPPSRHYSVMWPPEAPLTETNIAQILDDLRRQTGDPLPPGTIVPGPLPQWPR
ncbi:hypothetical protein [Candidatus Nephthysia bennettiae]|uniref:Uncharacterized protein n=1 Tax=Candidatus Nephthysia bennettiae TaxID=3127016 RepID=A0A934K790_9BACT|nr:hypothetical protein [Candidatus Dormibacteraeota bacterium]